ncbi:PIN domain-containing protein [Rhodopirellula sp. JC639]|uniref:PIN domain-containing protein n=1 Tax=Stieleria mannarensis TaxID=2755585 RepID=UPI001600CAC0|nr:PIN domain-containing protein [Rhodopirellula sp. JC639]
MRPHYVFIDLENVLHDCTPQLVEKPTKILVFVGAKQSKLPVETVEALLRFGSQVELITISDSGPNALDFHIAYYLGKLSKSAPSAVFQIISNDKGFDPLIKHLKSQGINADRIKSTKAARPGPANKKGALAKRLEEAIERLQRTKMSKPRKVKTLHSTLASWFSNKLTDKDIQLVIDQLVAKKHVTISGAQVSYSLPKTK